MINGKRVLAVIPARGGSKGVPRKNIRILAGKPLIAWTIEEAKKSRYIDRLIVSTEDPEIIEVARAWGCEEPFVRPVELAQDDTPGYEVILHALSCLPGFDYVVLLQPTSPFRTVEDIDGCIEYCVQMNGHSCVSVTEPASHPYWMFTLTEHHRLKTFLSMDKMVMRRQELPKVYALNGAVYVAKSDWFITHRSFLVEEPLAYIMPPERSQDIDTEWDFMLAEMMMRMKIGE